MGSQPHRGDRVAGYLVEERLGEGGTSQVYRARHERSGRVVALKVLRGGRRLAPPSQVLALRHPNIARTFDVGTSQHGPYVAMELLQGTPLRAALARSGRVDATTALAVLVPVLGALAEAHRHGAVHGDVKPENVFLARARGGEVRVVLLDFGGLPAPEAGVVVGSASYLSPEQAEGQAPDARSDVFGAGVLLFELLIGTAAIRVERGRGHRLPHRPRARAAACPIPPSRLSVDVALAKAPAARFPGAAALRRRPRTARRPSQRQRRGAFGARGVMSCVGSPSIEGPPSRP